MGPICVYVCAYYPGLFKGSAPSIFKVRCIPLFILVFGGVWGFRCPLGALKSDLPSLPRSLACAGAVRLFHIHRMVYIVRAARRRAVQAAVATSLSFTVYEQTMQMLAEHFP